ncbi:MAG: NifU family protein [Candidatus Paceibacterota bacterium]
MDVNYQIQTVLEEIRPMLEADGGGVELSDFSDGNLTLDLLGACSGCPMSSITFGVVLESKLREVCGDKIKNIYYNTNSPDNKYHLSK